MSSLSVKAYGVVVQDFCPLAINITRFSNGFRLKIWNEYLGHFRHMLDKKLDLSMRAVCSASKDFFPSEEKYIFPKIPKLNPMISQEWGFPSIAYFRVPFTSVSKRVLVQNLSDENEFYSHFDTRFKSNSFSFEWFRTKATQK